MNAFVEVVKEYDADQYGFILRETQTGEIIDDVASGKSELGLLYLSESNETVLSSCCAKVSSCSRNCSLPHRMCSSIRTIRSQTGSASRSMN